MNKDTTIKRFSAHGKFLITGEYAVLDNVPALAIPLKLNQHLEICPRDDHKFSWKSYDVDNSLWFNTVLNLELLKTKDPVLNATLLNLDAVTIKLIDILRKALELNSNAAVKMASGFNAITTLDFNRSFGMGTSSTLISLIAQWLECDVYALQFACFGGSGYDIACATAQSALIYNYNDAAPQVRLLDWNPAIKDSIFFVYLNRKQNSRDSIARFNKELLTTDLRKELSEMPQEFINSSSHLQEFHKTMRRHELIISSLIGLEPVQEKLFKDYTGAIKSLGGWGGDFVMCTGGIEERAYFKTRGYDVLLEWDDVVM